MSMTADAITLHERLRGDLAPGWDAWSGGWPGEIEVALIDVVASIRATYGSPTTGVRAVIDRYRAWRLTVAADGGAGGEEAVLDHLPALAACEPESLAAILRNRQRTMGGGLKTQAMIDVATALGEAGVRCAADLEIGDEVQRAAFTAVPGLGEISWQYFGLVLGRPGAEVLAASEQYVAQTLGRPMTARQAQCLLAAAARGLGVPATTVQRGLWTRARRLSSAAGAGLT